MDGIYTFVRGVKIPTKQIEQIEQEYGVKLVPDTEGNILRALDRTLQVYRLTHDHADPDVTQLSDFPEYLFKHMVLNIQFMGMEIPGAYNKPCWFRFNKSHPIHKSTKKYS